MRGLLTSSQLNKSCDDDKGQSQHLGVSEHILNPGSPFHTGTVHKGQHHYKIINKIEVKYRGK
jgi:hypothetical protein